MDHWGKEVNSMSLFLDLGNKNDVYEVMMEPGDILIVPPKWWHYVECLETSLAVNTWIPLVSAADSI